MFKCLLCLKENDMKQFLLPFLSCLENSMWLRWPNISECFKVIKRRQPKINHCLLSSTLRSSGERVWESIFPDSSKADIK